MKYIFLDIDGTLYDHKAHCIPESAYRAVRLAKEQGHKIFICTGRCLCMLDHVKKIGYEGVVAAAGAYVAVNDQVVYEECLKQDELNRILDHCTASGITYILEGKKGVYMHPSIREFFSIGKGRNTAGHEFFKQKEVHGLEKYDEKEEMIFKLCLYADNEETLLSFQKQLSETYHLIIGQANENQPFGAELTLKKNNKASGIRKALAYLGGDMADTVGVGDSMNDLEMLKECAIAIAMGNGDERIKPYADYITSNIDEDGILQAFSHYKLI